jgi:hypothetical protein
MTLPELQSMVDYLDIRLSVRGDRLEYDAPDDVLTENILAALRQHKAALITMLTGPVSQACRGAQEEEYRSASPVRWTEALGAWPIPWREAWGRLANALEDETRDTDRPVTFSESGPPAYGMLVDRFDLQADPQPVLDAITGERGWTRIVLSGYTGVGVKHEPLSDAEAVAAIDWAFAPPKPAVPSDRGPRDVRRGDRWLPWHGRSARPLRCANALTSPRIGV